MICSYQWREIKQFGRRREMKNKEKFKIGSKNIWAILKLGFREYEW